MEKLDFSDRSLIEKYWRIKFNFDMSNYFLVEGWKTFDYGKRHRTKEDTVIRHLYQRRHGIADGEPAIYMGCGPWWNVQQNFEFSGMFAYLYIVSKCLLKHYGWERRLSFCQAFDFPLIDDGQTTVDFDVVATMKEAGIAPAKAEAGNYLSMLDAVIPFMEDVTTDYMKDLSGTLREEVMEHLETYRQWVMGTKDEILSFNGLRIRKEYMPENRPYPARYCFLQPMTFMASRYGVYSFGDLVSKKLDRALWSYGDIKELDGPAIPHYKDLEFMREQDQVYHGSDEDSFRELTEKEENENRLYNTLINLHLYDETFVRNGMVGLKDCWERVVVPARFEDCSGICMARQHYQKRVCVPVKQDGKWALFRRGTDDEFVTFARYDEINVNFHGYYVVRHEGRYGLFTQFGRQLLPARMDDIYEPTICEWHILYKQDGKYGILYNSGIMTQELFDEPDLESGEFLSVRMGNRWGYLDEKGAFVCERHRAFLLRNGFSFESMVHYKNGMLDDFDPDHINMDDYIPLDECLSMLDKEFYRFSRRVDFRESCLKGRAKVEMGIDKNILYFTLFPEEITFCVDMERPYLLRLRDDKYHDLVLSWDGHEKDKELLKAWLNEPNRRTGVLNWAEAMYAHCHVPCNREKRVIVSYAYRKTMDMSSFPDEGFEDIDFPRIEYRV